MRQIGESLPCQTHQFELAEPLWFAALDCRVFIRQSNERACFLINHSDSNLSDRDVTFVLPATRGVDVLNAGQILKTMFDFTGNP